MADGRVDIRSLKLFMLCLFILVSTSCAQKVEEKSFDADLFKSDKYNLVLGFDLRDDDKPSAGLLIRGNSSLSIHTQDSKQNTPQADTSSPPVAQVPQIPSQHILFLPFKVSSVQK